MRFPILVALLAASLPAQSWAFVQDQPKAPDRTVRELAGEFRNLDIGSTEAVAAVDGKGLRKVLADRIHYQRDASGIYHELTAKERETFADDMAKALEKQVDYAKEQIVLVRMQTGGPPFGTPGHEIRKGPNKKEVVFFVQAPKSGPRGERAKTVHVFFAVPAGFAVTMEKGERP